MKSLCKRFAIGFLLSAVIGDLIAILTTGDWTHFYSPRLLAWIGNPVGAIIVQTLFSALIGAAGMSGTMLYETNLPLAAATALHFALIEAVFLPVGLCLSWVSGVKGIVVMSGFMLAAFFLIWLVMYLHYRREAKRMNEILRKDAPDRPRRRP